MNHDQQSEQPVAGKTKPVVRPLSGKAHQISLLIEAGWEVQLITIGWTTRAFVAKSETHGTTTIVKRTRVGLRPIDELVRRKRISHQATVEGGGMLTKIFRSV